MEDAVAFMGACHVGVIGGYLPAAISKNYTAVSNLSSFRSYARIMSQQWPVRNHPAIGNEFDADDIST